ncbi:MAG: DUF4255 domain-containing protein [Candidatus Methanoperedens sp.]|nr:DUF4255 domain-containing protein [Candidatus Methanoperedens sp.]
MSNFLAIATVTATLCRMLQAGMINDVTGAGATSVRPNATDSGTPTTGVNVYLYQVTPNASLRGWDLPTRSSGGELVQRPLVALDLHYLLTFYGEESELLPQRLLGSAVKALHAQPVLTRKMIEQTIQETAYLEKSNLADAIESIKFTPIPLSLEELSKLWSIFFQTAYRLSIAYLGTVVMIESEDSPQKALPVRDRNVYVMPFRQPVIERIVSKDGEEKPIFSDSTILIHGKKLRGDITKVRIGGIDIQPLSGNIRDTHISMQLPPGLHAGILGVQVFHQIMMGTPPVPHKGVESAIVPFVLYPSITDNIDVTEYPEDGQDLTIKLKPTLGKKQRVALMMNPLPGNEGISYYFTAVSRNEDSDSITIRVSNVEPGDYLVRVQVDGAQSPLIVDTNPASPTFNQYTGPKVTIP